MKAKKKKLKGGSEKSEDKKLLPLYYFGLIVISGILVLKTILMFG